MHKGRRSISVHLHEDMKQQLREKCINLQVAWVWGGQIEGVGAY